MTLWNNLLNYIEAVEVRINTSTEVYGARGSTSVGPKYLHD